MTIVTGHTPGMAEFARVAREAMQDWLHDYEGFRGVLVFTDEQGGRSRIVTLWETPADEERARVSRAAMRDRVVAAAGMTVEAVELYEVPVCEVVPAPGP